MKIVAVLGSPHGMKGTTGTLLGEVLSGAEHAGAAAATLSLADYRVGPCVACNACHVRGVCTVRDDFDRLKVAARDADAIVLASPNYIFSVSAQMKTFLDRCCGLLHCQAWAGKYGAAVVTSGGPGSGEVEAYTLRFLRAMGCWTVGSVGIEGFRLGDAAARDACFEAARHLGRRLVEAAGKKETFAEQSAEKDAFRERMKRLVVSRKAEWPFEHEHWKSRGWL